MQKKKKKNLENHQAIRGNESSGYVDFVISGLKQVQHVTKINIQMPEEWGNILVVPASLLFYFDMASASDWL